MPLKPRTPCRVSAKYLLRQGKGGTWLVVTNFWELESFVLITRSSGHDVPVNLQQMLFFFFFLQLLLLTLKGQSPENRLSSIFQARDNILLQKGQSSVTKHRQHSTKFKVTGMHLNLTPGHIPRQNHNSKRYTYPVFTAALFTIAKTRKQPKRPSTNQRIKKMCYIYKQCSMTQK